MLEDTEETPQVSVAAGEAGAAAFKASPSREEIFTLCMQKVLCFSNSKVYVTCSRTLCNRVIKVPVLSKPVVIYRKVQIICVHCNETFLWPAGKSSLSRCPHCLKISSFGRSYARKHIAFFCVMTVCFAIATGVVIGLTVTRTLPMGLYAIWTFLFLVCLFYAYKTGFWISVKFSRPVENTTSEGQTSSPHPRPAEYGPGPDSFITTNI